MGDIRTWRCGEVGVEGTRYVLPGGIISVEGILYQQERLEPYVGQIVRFHDDDGELGWDAAGKRIRSIAVGLCYWHHNGGVTMRNEPYLGRAWEIGVDEKAARRIARAAQKRRERRSRLGGMRGA